jgi:nitroimidazol reductase NimA-like FMN-containing flavoprotein (pyridoxamine 5'-phosphate oxidase superfamily)/ribosomal protein S18 acetylase RimI-like enzyme
MSTPRKYGADEATARSVFAETPVVHLASTLPDGRPLLRTVHAALVDGSLIFHGAVEGEKLGMLGRPTVVSAERVVARVPSHFVNPTLACPATTYYVSAMARGTPVAIAAPERKAAALEAFMQRHQPEGGYTPITASHKTYRSLLDQLIVAELELTELTAKRKLGQNRSRKQIERITEHLWMRGAPGDLEAIEPILAAHPDAPDPTFLRATDDVTLCPAPTEGDLSTVVELLRAQNWLHGESAARIAEAHRGSRAWVGLRARRSGQLVGSARAVTDGARHALIADVVVAPTHRGRGLGTTMLRLLLDHHMLRRVTHVQLSTRDATGFYAKLGFHDERAEDVAMARIRPHAIRSAPAEQTCPGTPRPGPPTE